MSRPKEDGVEVLSNRILLGGAFLTAVIAVVLLSFTYVSLLHAAGLAALLGLFPAVAIAQVPLVRSIEITRRQVYSSSVGTLLFLGVASGALAVSRGGPGLSFHALPLTVMAGWTLLLLAGGVVVELAFRALAIRFGIREEPMLRAILPETAGERWAFAALSVCAGFSEEMAYRGYVIPMLLPHLGVVGAVAASSLAFGLLHAYQGGIGILRTGIIGILMAGGYLMSGSLWPPVLAHLLFDILAGIFLAEYFMVPEETVGVSAEVETSVEV